MSEANLRLEIGIADSDDAMEVQEGGVFWPDGARVSSYRNARTALLALGYEFYFNRRANKFLMKPAGSDKLRVVTDKHRYQLRQKIADRFNFAPAKEHLADAIAQLCYENVFDPVCDYVNSLKRKKAGKLDGWLTTYLGVEDTPLTRAIGTIVLVAAVRRARHPGCRFDEILVLVGKQGLGKSRAIRCLACRPSWYSDQEVLQLNAQQQQEALEGVWIYELSELGGLNKSTIERTKAFVSRTRDRARKAYGRGREDQRRGCIFIATTNEETFLTDYTGNRRFWPVAPTKIRLKALRRDRDQLWAEAAHLERTGFALRLPKSLWPEAAKLQSARLEDDPWIEQLRDLQGTLRGNEYRISFSEVIERLNLGASWQTARNWKRVSACMHLLGWRRVAKPFKLAGRTVRGFARDV